jgi:cell division protein FtsI (penicillin-binding protein 3)
MTLSQSSNLIRNSQTASDPFKSRFVVLMVLCLLGAALLAGRAAWIQIGGDKRLENLSRRQFKTKFLVSPRRGAILDRNGEPLAINSETRSLAMNPQKVVHRRAVARLLSRTLDIPQSRLLQKMDDRRGFAWIKRHLTEHEFEKLRTHHLIGADGDLISGLWIVSESERVYPHRELAAHVIGGTNLDSEGTEGIELLQNEKLRGKVISVSAVRDALGRPAFIDSKAAKAAQEGRDGEPVSLTIDASLQYSVEEELRNAVRKANARGGSVIVMNAMNGEILAMANEPSFDPNVRGASPDRKRNRALTDGYEPGSTLKPALLAAALLNGMHLTDQIYGERGHFKIGGRTISEAEAHERFEWLSLKKIIQVSSNVGAAKLALKLGADKYMTSLRSFGFGTKTGIEFPGEISGRVPSRKAWTPITLANIGFGHGVLVTPIQMARLYAAFLNGGWLVEPTLIKSANNQQPEPRRVMPEKVTAQVIEALESTTQTKEGGTAGNAVLSGYRVAGKTGTAQKVDPATGKYSRSKYVASFIGFPLQVEPKIVIFASIDEPHGSYYGGQVAAPLFREVLNAVANRFSLPAPAGTTLADSKPAPPPADMIRSSQAAIAKAAAQQGVLNPGGAASGVGSASGSGSSADSGSGSKARLDPHQPAGQVLSVSALGKLELASSATEKHPVWKMPVLRGLTPREVVDVLEGHSLHLDVKGVGFVRMQSPEAGREIAEGGTVKLTLGESE